MKKVIAVALLGIQTSSLYCVEDMRFDESHDIKKRIATPEQGPSIRERAAMFDPSIKKVDLPTQQAAPKETKSTDQGLRLELNSETNPAQDFRDSIQSDLHDIHDLQIDYQHIDKRVKSTKKLYDKRTKQKGAHKGLQLPETTRNTYDVKRTVETLDQYNQDQASSEEEQSAKEKLDNELREIGNIFQNKPEKHGKQKNKDYLYDDRENTNKGFQSRNTTARQYTEEDFSDEKLSDVQSSLSKIYKNADVIHNAFEQLSNEKLTQSTIDSLQRKLQRQESFIAKIADPTLQTKLRNMHTKSQELVIKLQDAFIKQTIESNNLKDVQNLYDHFMNAENYDAASNVAQQVSKSKGKALRKFNAWEWE